MATSASHSPRVGASDSPETLAARARLTPGQRLQWLSESLDLALATGALDRDRDRRHREALAWSAAPTGAGKPGSTT